MARVESSDTDLTASPVAYAMAHQMLVVERERGRPGSGRSTREVQPARGHASGSARCQRRSYRDGEETASRPIDVMMRPLDQPPSRLPEIAGAIVIAMGFALLVYLPRSNPLRHSVRRSHIPSDFSMIARLSSWFASAVQLREKSERQIGARNFSD